MRPWLSQQYRKSFPIHVDNFKTTERKFNNAQAREHGTFSEIDCFMGQSIQTSRSMAHFQGIDCFMGRSILFNLGILKEPHEFEVTVH